MTTRTWFSVLTVVTLVVGVGIGLPARSIAQATDQVTLGIAGNVPTWDPQSTGILATELVATNIYDTLIKSDAAQRLRPGLAVSWTMIDPTTWEFKLRRNVVFQDGEPFNAQAVKFSFDRALDPKTKNARASLLRLIAGVTVVDNYTVRFTTQHPWPLFLPTIARHGWIVPPRYLQQSGPDALVAHPIGTGPYRLISWTVDDRAELEANPTYWGGTPRIKHVTIRIIPSQPTRLSELLSGSVNLIDQVPPDLMDPIQRSPRTKLVGAPAAAIFLVEFNLINMAPTRPLADKRVRQALNYAIDRTQINQSIMHNTGALIATFCPPAGVGCDASIPPFPYDPQRARDLLRDAGYPNGIDMTMGYTNGIYPEDHNIALAIVDQLGRVGVRVTPSVMDYGIFISQLASKKIPYDAFLSRSTAQNGYFEEVAAQALHTGGAASFWSNFDFDVLLDTAEVTTDRRGGTTSCAAHNSWSRTKRRSFRCLQRRTPTGSIAISSGRRASTGC